MPKESLEELQYAEYWDRRYREEQEKAKSVTNDGSAGADAAGGEEDATIPAFEWFRDFAKLRPFLEKYLPTEGKEGKRLLHLGCGNSTLTADLHALGYTTQTSVDFSSVVISAMSTKYASLNTTWLQMDIRDMSPISSSSIDIAIDKGTLDAMLHGSLWDPPEDVRDSVGRYVDEVARVLKPGARWLYITYRQPHFLRPLLKREAVWDAEVEVLEDPDGNGGGFEYFGWVMTKKGNAGGGQN